MWRLNLPEYYFKLKNKDGLTSIFDEFRRKWVKLTPEEWVRQHFLRYLVEELGYPFSLIALERKINVGGFSLRFDAVIYDKDASILVLLEFKAPQIKLERNVFDQANTYNTKIKAPFLMISNGNDHYFSRVDHENNHISISKILPKFELISKYSQ